MSIGIEDVMAFKDSVVLLIQCKNTKRGEKSMTKDEIDILKKHAKDVGAIPVYLYKAGRNKYVWQDVNTGWEMERLNAYTMQWYRNRMKMRKKLREMKKKNLNDYNKYVLKNWSEVKEYIC